MPSKPTPAPKPAPALPDVVAEQWSRPRPEAAGEQTEQLDVGALLARLEATEAAAKAAAQQTATLRADLPKAPARAKAPARSAPAHRTPAEAWSLATMVVVALLVLGAVAIVVAYLYALYVPH